MASRFALTRRLALDYNRGAGGNGETGRRAALRMLCRKAWGFESPFPHQTTAYLTVKYFVALALPQVTVTGQLPFGVLFATVQDQLTAPEPPEVFGPRPAALLGTPL